MSRNKFRKHILTLAAVVLVCASTALTAWGQVTAGGLRGVVTDSQDAAMPGISVRATNIATGVSAETTTTSAGVYVISSLTVGEYKIEAKAKGFKTFVAENVRISTATVGTLNIAMQVGEVVETVNVHETTAPMLQTDSAEIGVSVEQHVVMDLPLPMSGDRRQAESFIFLTPGVSGNTFSKYVNGSPDMMEQVSVEGAIFSNSEVPGRFYDKSPPFEAIEEFKMSTSLYPPEQGRSFGVESFAFKSGTNAFHGNMFEFLRNNKFDARGFFASAPPTTRQNDFGATTGGRIIKNRTFFFVTYEGFRVRGASNNSMVTLPIAPFRTGDFSKYVNPDGSLIPLYDPGTTTSDGKGGFTRTPFAGNLIPSSRVDPLAAKVIGLLPQPDLANQIVGNYHSRSQNPSGLNLLAYKVDHQITQNQKISVSHWFNFMPASGYSSDLGPGQPLDGGYPGSGTFQGLRVNYDWVIRPNLLNHAGYGFGGTSKSGRGYDSRNGADVLPVSGLPSSYGCVTAFNIPGYPYIGNCGQVGDGRTDQTHNFSDMMTIIKGRHQIKFGGEYWYQTYSNYDLTTGGGPGGTIGFSRLSTDLPNSPTFGSAGYGFASFFLGQVDSLQRLIGEQPREYILPYMAFHVSDTVQFGKFTLNLGLRYDLSSPWRDSNPMRISGLGLTTPNPAAGNLPGAYVFGNSAIVPARDKREWAPRVSLAYRMDSQTVIRAGFARMYAIGNANAVGSVQFGNAFDSGFTGNQNIASINSDITPAGILKNGFPVFSGTLPNQVSTLNVNSLADYYNAGGAKQSYINTWTLDIQRSLPWQLFADVAYIGNKTGNLPGNMENINQVPFKYLSLGSVLNADIGSTDAKAAGISAPYAGFTGTVAQALRPFPQYTSINDPFQPTGASTYEALQSKLQKRFSSRLSFLVSYTLSKTLTNTGVSGFASFNTGARDTANRNLEKHLAGSDQTHNFVTSLVYELPIGQSLTGVPGKIVKGWEVTAILRNASGTPLGISGGGPIPLFGGGNAPNRVSGVSARSSVSPGSFDPAKNIYLNPAAFSQPGAYILGNASPSEPSTRGFPFHGEDFSVIKRTKVREAMDVEFRAEFFNLFNRVIFSNPSTGFNDLTSFGLVTGQANTPRQIQFGMKFRF